MLAVLAPHHLCDGRLSHCFRQLQLEFLFVGLDTFRVGLVWSGNGSAEVCPFVCFERFWPVTTGFLVLLIWHGVCFGFVLETVFTAAYFAGQFYRFLFLVRGFWQLGLSLARPATTLRSLVDVLR